MAGERNSRGLLHQPNVRLHHDSWFSPPVRVADTFRSRWIGLRPIPGPFGVLMPARSVHGLGLRHGVGCVLLDRDGRVLWSLILAPGRVTAAPTARWALELPGGHSLPAPGTVLGVDRLASCPDA